MTASKRAWMKSRTEVRVIDRDLRQVEVRFPDGLVVQAWLVAGLVKVFKGGPVNREEQKILEEKVHDIFPEQEQRSLFG